MATLEKPKRKSKKSVPLKTDSKKNVHEAKHLEVQNEIEQTSSETIEAGTSDKQNDGCTPQASTSETSENVPVATVSTETVFVKTSEVKITEETTTKQVTTEKVEVEKKVEVSKHVEVTKVKPTAPVFEEVQPKVVYPVLPAQEMSRPVQVQNEILKPFTAEQLAALYTNPELTASKEFVTCFVESELRAGAGKKHPLYDMIGSYARAREHLRENKLELDKFRKELENCQERAWVLEKKNVSGSAQCLDGVLVLAAHEYQTAKLQKGAIDEINQIQSQIRQLANETHTLYSYTTVTLKLKIEHYLQSVVDSCLCSVPPHGPLVVLADSPQHQMRELRVCISVLFSYQRRPTRDRMFITETREWLNSTVAALLRLADWQDHAYVLCHVLRCPAGVGLWAGRYVQVPVMGIGSNVFADKYLNHAVTVLGILLRGAEKREEFLGQMSVSQDGQDNPWVLVDSDGEEDASAPVSLKENDLVTLMNQVPLADLFRSVLRIYPTATEDDEDIDSLNMDEVTEHHVLRLFAFCTVAVDLLNEGLNTYGTQRYHQFVKRLCRLIRHILQYASDTWEAFISCKTALDCTIKKRLQLEFDMLFLRCGRYLYGAQGLGAWQFLAVLPFHTVTLPKLWQFFYMLHEGETNKDDIDYRVKLADKEIQQQFEEKLCVMGVEESYYLLNTFGNMIMARPEHDNDFIQFATVNLLQIGFIGEATQESCSKCAAILLSNVTSRYPMLISDILSVLKEVIEKVGQLSLYLFRELPLHVWRPTDKDMETLSGWLLKSPVSSIESHLARLIIAGLNWDFERDNVLFLPLQQHMQVALLAAEFVEQQCGGDVSPPLFEAVRQPSPEQMACRWAWQLVYRLRLHVTDRRITDVSRVPDLVTFDVLQKGVRSQQPLCRYLSLMMTTTGHLVPMVCSHGFTQLQVMLSTHRYEAVLVALQSLVPLFIECPDSLVVSTSFQGILSSLLSADRTYVKMAKSLISSDFPGQLLRQFGYMLEQQVSTRPNGPILLSVWAQALLAGPAWNKDPGVLYLLDIIVRAAFFDGPMYCSVAEAFRKLFEKSMERVNSGGSSLLSWMSGGQNPPTLLAGVTSQPQYPWLAYLCLEIEHELLEVKTGLWKELLVQLYHSSGKTSIDNCLKKACTAMKMPVITSGGLCLYRWAQQALDTPLEHPLLPLLWQKFFQLYLGRVPPGTSNAVSGGGERGCVGSKFFDGMVNTSFCKRLKRRLQETLSATEAMVNQETGDVVRRCHSLYRAYVVWLEEPLLQEATLYLPSLPPQYEPHYLSHILHGSVAPWLECVDMNAVRISREKAAAEWRSIRGRGAPRRPAPPPPYSSPGGAAKGSSAKDSPARRMVRRLASYDRPQPPPQPQQDKASLLPSIPVDDKDTLVRALQPHLRKLEQLAELYSLQLSEHSALDKQFLELLPHLYRMHKTGLKVKKSCKPACSRQAVIPLNFTEAQTNEAVRQQLQTNRAGLQALLARSLQPLAAPAVAACAAIERAVDRLCSAATAAGNEQCSASQSPAQRIAGAEMFHVLVTAYGDQQSKYPPTQQLLTGCIDRLGRYYVAGVERECVRVCRLALREPHRAPLLVPHFSPSPSTTSTASFLAMYSEVTDCAGEVPDVAHSLLSRLDVAAWLTGRRPRLAERSQFIGLVFSCLQRAILEPPSPGPGTGLLHLGLLHLLARQHLLLAFRHEFPEHYGEVLRSALSASARGELAPTVWRDLLGVLVSPGRLAQPDRSESPDTTEIRRLASEQRTLRQDMLIESTAMFGRYFSQERLRHDPTYGLYPRYRAYVQEFSALFSFVSHSLISAVVSGTGQPADRLVEVTFPRLIELWGPWVIPGWPHPNPGTMHRTAPPQNRGAATMLDDRAVTLPWLQADSELGKKMFASMIDSISFMKDTLPASTSVLCHTWQLYVTSYAHQAVKSHVLSVVHQCLLELPWNVFWPSVQDLETMVRVADQYLPDCHIFLSHVFLQVDWTMWLWRLVGSPVPGAPQAASAPSCPDPAIHARAQLCLLHLLVKLGVQGSGQTQTAPSANIDRAVQLLTAAQQWGWRVLRPPDLAHVLDWYVMSADPRVMLGEDDVKTVEYAVLDLLRIVSCLDSNDGSSPISTGVAVMKRQCFLRACMKLLINCCSRHKNLISSKPKLLQAAVTKHLDHIEVIVTTLSQTPKEEADVLLMEVLALLNNSILSHLVLETIEAWFLTRSFSSPMLPSFFRVGTTAITGSEPTGRLLEAALVAYFGQTIDRQDDPPSWVSVIDELKIGAPKQPPIEQSLVTNERLLALHAIIVKRLQNCDDYLLLLDSVVDWLADLKIIESTEQKAPLVWADVLTLAEKQCRTAGSEHDQGRLAGTLRRWCQQLLAAADRADRAAGWGRAVLGALTGRGGSGGQPSARCRLLCRALAGYCLAQLPDSRRNGGHQTVRCVAMAPNPVGQPGGSTECARVLLRMDPSGSQQQELRPITELALKQIQDPQNSMHNAVDFLYKMVELLYSKSNLIRH